MILKRVSKGKLKSITDKGQFEAVIATLGVIDRDGDLIKQGAIPQGQAVKIASWGHKWDQLPTGKGNVYERGNELTVKGHFFLDTQAGWEHYQTVKNLGELQEWSFGYDVLESHPEKYNGKQIRVLDRLTIYEVSPVLVGAGINTRTTAIKVKKRPKPWRLEALEQMTAEVERKEEVDRKKRADYEFCKKIVIELEKFKASVQDSNDPIQSSTTELERITRQIATSDPTRPMTWNWALLLAKNNLLDLARNRLIRRGIDPHTNPVALQQEEALVIRWATLPKREKR